MIEVGVAIVLLVIVLTWPRRSLDRPAGVDRFAIDDGAAGPYHAPGLARRAVWVEALAWLGERLSPDVVLLAGAVHFVLVELVIVKGIREGWWVVLRDCARSWVDGTY